MTDAARPEDTGEAAARRRLEGRAQVPVMHIERLDAATPRGGDASSREGCARAH